MDHGTKEQGGDLGWNRRGNMVPEFDRWMFALPPGTISPVIETVFGYHIIRVDRVKPAEVKASHILVRWKIDSSQVVAAKREADTVLAALEGGGQLRHARPALPRFERGKREPPAFPAGLPAGHLQGGFSRTDRGLVHRAVRDRGSWHGQVEIRGGSAHYRRAGRRVHEGRLARPVPRSARPRAGHRATAPTAAQRDLRRRPISRSLAPAEGGRPRLAMTVGDPRGIGPELLSPRPRTLQWQQSVT